MAAGKKEVIRKESGIYKIMCRDNSKAYIGSTGNLRARRTQHFTELRRKIHGNHHLQNIYNKYGENSLTFEVIEYCPIEKLEEREIYWDNLTPKELRINIRPISNSNFGILPSQETKNKISKALKGVSHSYEWNEKVSKSKKGLKHSYEHILASAQEHKRRVQQIDLQTSKVIAEFESQTEAEKLLELVREEYLMCVTAEEKRMVLFVKLQVVMDGGLYNAG